MLPICEEIFSRRAEIIKQIVLKCACTYRRPTVRIVKIICRYARPLTQDVQPDATSPANERCLQYRRLAQIIPPAATPSSTAPYPLLQPHLPPFAHKTKHANM
jgi:hypothetical protein